MEVRQAQYIFRRFNIASVLCSENGCLEVDIYHSNTRTTHDLNVSNTQAENNTDLDINDSNSLKRKPNYTCKKLQTFMNIRTSGFIHFWQHMKSWHHWNHRALPYRKPKGPCRTSWILVVWKMSEHCEIWHTKQAPIPITTRLTTVRTIFFQDAPYWPRFRNSQNIPLRPSLI